MTLAIAAELDYEIYMIDAQKAFLNSDVEERVFVKIPPGYDRSNKAGVSLAMKPKKSLYGPSPKPQELIWYDGLVPRQHRISPVQI